jgi:hypothetical protein
MLGKQAIKYYLYSTYTLLTNFNWWVFPLLAFKRPILIKIKNNLNFYVSNFMDIWTLKEVIVDRQYEAVKEITMNLGTVIDIGAAIGDFSIYAAKKGKKVIAYECDDERILLMKKNIMLNKISNIVLKHIEAKSLKQIMKNVSKCDFLKIDCEGCEYDLFKNARNKDLEKINFIAMEAHKFDDKMRNEFSNLITILKNNKFKIKIIPNSVHEYICFLFAKR